MSRMIEEPRARMDARETNERARALLHLGHGPARWAPVAGWVLCALGIVFVLLQPTFVTRTANGQDASIRDAVLVVPVSLAGLRIAAGPGRHLVASMIAGLAGLLLIAGAVFAEHASVGMAVFEGVLGSVAVIGAVVAATSPVPAPREPVRRIS